MSEKTNVYEGMFLFDANRFARDRDALPSEVAKMIESGGGEVLVSRLWEERRLAYPIKGHRKGTYWLMYFRAPSSAIEPLHRQCELNEGVLRQLVLKIHPHLVDAVLEHARQDQQSIAGPPAGPAEGEKEATKSAS